MANPEHLAKIRDGAESWNTWRDQNPDLDIDLSRASLAWRTLRQANLKDVGLSGADLSRTKLRGADLRDSDLSLADLHNAEMTSANLVAVDLTRANLSKADLFGANLSGARLFGADLSGVDLRQSKLHDASLVQTNLCGADLSEASLYRANLSSANLFGADLRSATLQWAVLDDANVTEIRLWESQRGGWSIKGIRCECAFWGEDASAPTYYAPGEFERLYSEQTCIELFYQGGVSTFELNTLPALLQHLASIHPDNNIRLKSIEETGGGARISISVGKTDSQTAEKIKTDAMQVYQAQLALRDKETERLQIEKNYLESLFVGKLIPAMLSAGATQNVFNAPVTGFVQASGESKVDFHQTLNDNAALLAVLERMTDRRAELPLPAPEASRFETELDSAKSELQKRNPDQSVLRKSIRLIQNLAAEALKGAAGKIGEQAVLADWQSWLHELSRFVSHLS